MRQYSPQREQFRLRRLCDVYIHCSVSCYMCSYVQNNDPKICKYRKGKNMGRGRMVNEICEESSNLTMPNVSKHKKIQKSFREDIRKMHMSFITGKRHLRGPVGVRKLRGGALGRLSCGVGPRLPAEGQRGQCFLNIPRVEV